MNNEDVGNRSRASKDAIHIDRPNEKKGHLELEARPELKSVALGKFSGHRL
jgi:hypothetical protein